MEDVVVSLHLQSRLSSMVQALRSRSGIQSDIISQTETIKNSITVNGLYALIDMLSELHIFTIQPQRRILPFYTDISKLKFNRKMKRNFEAIQRNSKSREDSDDPQHDGGLVVHETNPLRDSSSIIGFAEEMKQIESWLTASGEKEVDGVRSMGIVGRCGTGKTSLAKKVFHSSKEKFSPRIWVCMSKLLSKTNGEELRVEVVNRMLEWINHAVKQKKSESDLDNKLRKLRNRLTGKRYLIVLDDVWLEDKWYDLTGGGSERPGSLSYGLPKGSGGTVIVTSRRESVIENIVGDKLVLEGVGDKICWEIFNSTAVRHRQQGRTDITEIENDAIRASDGLPFAAKTLADIIFGGEARNQHPGHEDTDSQRNQHRGQEDTDSQLNHGGQEAANPQAAADVEVKDKSQQLGADGKLISVKVKEMRNQVLKDFNEPSSQQIQILEKLNDVQKTVDELMPFISPEGQTSSQNQGANPHDSYLRTDLSKAWMNLGVEKKIIGIEAISTLNNTFKRLEVPHSKICSFCLSVFPDNNADIKKRPLIYWWIGEGLVAENEEATAEEVGEQVFQELLEEGFIKPTTSTSTSTSTSSFTVSPWIRLMLMWLANKSGFLKFTSNGSPCNSERRTFLWRKDTAEIKDERERESVQYGDGGESESVPKGNDVERKSVRTVFNVNVQYLGNTAEWLRQQKKVEVLQMGRWHKSAAHHIEVEDSKEPLFNGLGSQKHLKYLSLRGISRIESLPPSITKLVSLQILDLRACHNLENLPDRMAELKNLTHLDISECYLLETMPKGLERLSNLQVLKGFVVGNPANNACRLGDMARLSKLRKLSLRVLKHDNQQMETLKNFKSLQILSISWSGELAKDPVEISLPEKLTKLKLRCVPFEAVPEWMKADKVPKNLKLYITGGKLKSINIVDYKNRGVDVRHNYLKLE